MYSKGIKIVVMTLLITLLGTCFAFAAEVPSDVAGKSCETAVSELMDEGIITGDTDGLFHPDSELTRAQVCIMVAKTIDSTGINNTSYIQAGKKFKDMDGYNWAAGAIGMMAEKKMAKGYYDGSFRPGANVTMAELITFAVRACGDKYNDENIGGIWPENYIEAAKKLGFIENQDTSNYKTLAATKSDAAVIIWKASKIIKQNKQEKDDDTATYTFATIKFNKAVNCINDMPIAENAVVYSYGKSSEYIKTMSVPSKSKLVTEDINKYQNVSTKVLYKVVNGKVAEIILPKNCGFTGKIYGVINSADVIDNGDENSIIEFGILAAGKESTWETDENKIPENLADEDSYIWEASKNGELFELTAKNGKITAINIGNSMTGKYHEELTSGKWSRISKNADKEYELIFDGDEEEIELSENAVVYVFNDETGEYKISSVRFLYKNYYVRAYDVTDDDNDSADIVLAVKGHRV